MALQVNTPKREFILKRGNETITLPDPHPEMSMQEVINHYKPKYPEISTASLEGPKVEENKAVYRFSTVMGDKG